MTFKRFITKNYISSSVRFKVGFMRTFAPPLRFSEVSPLWLVKQFQCWRWLCHMIGHRPLPFSVPRSFFSAMRWWWNDQLCARRQWLRLLNTSGLPRGRCHPLRLDSLISTDFTIVSSFAPCLSLFRQWFDYKVDTRSRLNMLKRRLMVDRSWLGEPNTPWDIFRPLLWLASRISNTCTGREREGGKR